MITESLITGGFSIINLILKVLPTVPSMSDTFSNSFWYYWNTIFSNLSLISCFVRVSTIKLIIPLLIFIINFEFIYKLGLWAIKKLPFINIK